MTPSRWTSWLVAVGLALALTAGPVAAQPVPAAPNPVPVALTGASTAVLILDVGQDRFYATRVDDTLRERGITTLILAGWRENGSVVYTAVGANLHGYTVVVAEDAVSAGQPYDVAIGRYQLLTQLHGNPKNEPLLKGAVTLSRSDLITFK
jgi:hypothetical protein